MHMAACRAAAWVAWAEWICKASGEGALLCEAPELEAAERDPPVPRTIRASQTAGLFFWGSPSTGQ